MLPSVGGELKVKDGGGWSRTEEISVGKFRGKGKQRVNKLGSVHGCGALGDGRCERRGLGSGRKDVETEAGWRERGAGRDKCGEREERRSPAAGAGGGEESDAGGGDVGIGALVLAASR